MQFLKLFAIYCLMFIALTACTKANKGTGETFIGKSAPDFRLKDIHGKEVNLADMKGRVILLRFWSTRCVSCKEEMPKLETSYKNLKGKGFEILAVNVEDTQEKAMSFAHELNLTYPILIDENQNVANTYNVYGVPTTFFIDRHGVVRERIFGDIDKETIERVVFSLLEGNVIATSVNEEKKEGEHNHKEHQH